MRRRTSAVDRVVASFDVFDTVLVRRLVVGPLVSQFALDLAVERGIVAHRRTVDIASFERLAWAAAGRPVEVAEIWRNWCRHGALDESLADQLAAIEFEIESAFAMPCRPGTEAVLDARNAGRRIAFISDTPWSENDLARVLEQIGVLAAADPVFTSASQSCTKATGDLFPVALQALGADAGEVHHVGDDPAGDLRRARERGLAATLLDVGRPTRWELTLAQEGSSTRHTSSLLAGAARLARLEAQPGSLPRAAIDVSVGVAAPLLTAYVWWTIEQALHEGLDRLYFCGRDGELLLLIAQRLRASVDPEHRVELRYLRGSRRAWQLGAYPLCESGDVGWLLEGVVDVAVARSILGLDHEFAPGVVSVGELIESVKGDAALQAAVAAAAREAHDTMSAYLRQEGLMDDAAVGILDVGWSGRAIRPLDAVLRDAGRTAPVRYFFIGYERRGSDPWEGPVPQAFVPGSTSSAYLIEAFCASTSPSAWAYRPNDTGAVEVVDGPAEGAVLRAWGIDEHRASVLRMVDEFSRSVAIARGLGPSWSPDMSACAPVLGTLLEVLRTNPTADEAEGWGSFPMLDSHTAVQDTELAPQRAVIDSVRGTAGSSRWPAASVSRSSAVARWAGRTRVRAARLAARRSAWRKLLRTGSR